MYLLLSISGSSGSAIHLPHEYEEFRFSSDYESDDVTVVDKTAVTKMNRSSGGITIRRSPSPTTRTQDTSRVQDTPYALAPKIHQPKVEQAESQSDGGSQELEKYFSAASATSSSSSSDSAS